MPSLLNLKDQPKSVKMLVVGESGVGKTGALASLAKAGYNLKIADFENGLDPLIAQLADDKEAMGRVSFMQFFEKVKKGRVIAKAADAFVKALDEESDIGPVSKLGSKDVLVIDSYTSFGKAILNEVLRMNNVAKPRIQDWGEAVGRADAILQKLCSDEVRCHVIVLAHFIPEKSEDGGTIKWWPQAVTENQSRTIGRWFNTMVIMKATGSGSKVKRVVVTTPQPRFACKCPWKGVPEEIPIEEGYLPIIKKGERL